MSFILDALRKADAQRERDPARGIHAQPFAPAAGDRVQRSRRWLWAGIVGAGVVLAAVVWTFGRPVSGGVVLAPGVAGAAAPVAGSAQPPAASPPLGSSPMVAVAPAVAAIDAPSGAQAVQPAPQGGAARMSPRPPANAVLPAPPPPMAAPAAAPATASPARPAGPLPGTRPSTVSAPVATAPAAAPPAPAGPAAPSTASSPIGNPPSGDRLLAQAELPADVQRELPKVAITGGVYSETAAQRMLIVNGQVIHEGAEPAPGLVLEQIRTRSAVWRFRGHRYSVGY